MILVYAWAEEFGIYESPAVGIPERSWHLCDLQSRVTAEQMEKNKQTNKTKHTRPCSWRFVLMFMHIPSFHFFFSFSCLLRSGTEGHRSPVAPLASVSRICILTCTRCFWLKPALSNYSEPSGHPLPHKHTHTHTCTHMCTCEGMRSPLRMGQTAVFPFSNLTPALSSPAPFLQPQRAPAVWVFYFFPFSSFFWTQSCRPLVL